MNAPAQATTRPGAVARLAQLACLLDARRTELAQLDQLLAAIGPAGLSPVDGERTHAITLRQRLDEATARLQAVGRGEGDKASLDLLESLLDSGDWRLLQDLLPELQVKLSDQQRAAEELKGVLHVQRSAIVELRGALDQALRAGALVVAEEKEIGVLEDLLLQSERALAEGRYLDARALVDRLQAPGESRRSPDQLRQSIDAAAATARALAQRDELLLIGQPVEDKRWEYTLLLRSDRVNMQDSTTLVDTDREWARKVAQKVAGNVNLRLRAAARDLDPALPPEDTPPVDVQKHLRKVGETLYRLFVPDGMHQLLQRHAGERPHSLVLTTNDLELPWELLHAGEEFLCLVRPMSRMVMGHAQPREQRPTELNSKLRFLLVYADQKGNLPEAKKEVESISNALRTEWKDSIVVDTWTEPEDVTGERFNDALLDGHYDVIHYAGHARFDEQHPELSGLQLSNGDLLFAQKLRRLLSGQPLVFLNACESGRSANETSYMGRPAEGLASALLDGGAVACIGALWPVFDDAAAEFAISFYTLLMKGHVVGEALRQARIESRKKHAQSATWASFALYGDPTLPVARARRS